LTSRSESQHSFRILRHASLASTNDEALRCAYAGDPGGVWIVAESQTGGRGRQGRNWVSPPGNLYASLLLRTPGLNAARAPELGFVAGVALATTLRALLGGDRRLRIKWPNDILFDGAKLSGMLLESTPMPDGTLACVIGIGVNCTSHPEGVAYPTTDLASIGTLLNDPATLLDRLSAEMKTWLAVWAEGREFEAIRTEWLSLAAGLGDPIRFAGATRTLDGIFRTIDAHGRLVVDTQGGPATVDAGDVFIHRPTSPRHPAGRPGLL
jgi:BirA family biotin operon repressor/biotin-[acetyl-CoA-carboxylase] ligase